MRCASQWFQFLTLAMVPRVRRTLGVTLPLFSLRDRGGWGIGEISDLLKAGEWLRHGGVSLLQILPVHALPLGETSPYGAMTAFALDPIFLKITELEDFAPDRDSFLTRHGPTLERLEAAPRVDFRAVRLLKEEALRLSAARAKEELEEGEGERGSRFREFVESSRDWLEPFARYVVARELYESRDPRVALVSDPWSWRSWDPGARDPSWDPFQSSAERFFLVRYAQWLLQEEWDTTRKALAGHGIRLMGDLPFVVGRESADVFARPDLFRGDVSLGAPPDDFSEDGQDWGLPPFDWAKNDADDLSWHKRRAARERDLFDAIRIDHLVGLYRQYVRKPNELGVFDPQDEHAQQARGERMLSAIREAATPLELIAEDLGVIPDFVRASMAQLGLPGYRVIPWERDGLVYRHPSTFPAESVATWSTHDTAPITSWWGEFSDDERRALAASMDVDPGIQGEDLWHAEMNHLLASGSSSALALLQEVIGVPERINTPGTISDANWSWRLPATVSELEKDDGQKARLAWLAGMSEATGRR